MMPGFCCFYQNSLILFSLLLRVKFINVIYQNVGTEFPYIILCFISIFYEYTVLYCLFNAPENLNHSIDYAYFLS